MLGKFGSIFWLFACVGNGFSCDLMLFFIFLTLVVGLGANFLSSGAKSPVFWVTSASFLPPGTEPLVFGRWMPLTFSRLRNFQKIEFLIR